MTQAPPPGCKGTAEHTEDIELASNAKSPLQDKLVRTHYQATSAEEIHVDKRLNLKLDLLITGLLSFGFVLCGIDKTNIGYAATSTFVADANLSPNAIGNSLSIFSATYVPLQPLSVLAARRFGSKYWISGLLLAWGALSMCHALIKNQATLIALRLLLGAAESGFTPSSYYLMSTVYPKYIVGLRMGIFSGMYAIAGAFGGLIAYGLLQIGSSNIKGWQILFLFEGGLTVLVGIAAFFIIPQHLGTSWFLTESERAHAVRRMTIDSASSEPETGNGINIRDITDVCRDWKKILIILFNLLGVLPVNAFTTFLPLIVQGMGYQGTKASLMSVSPFIVGAIVLVIIVWSSDRCQERSGHMAGGMFLSAIGCIVMATSSNPRLRYGFSHVCMAGVFVSGPLAAAWLAGNTPLMVCAYCTKPEKPLFLSNEGHG
ncbi:hypothetical protein AbraIFM66950_005760 [Aspergillus brasiliensis]|nr:hypothetical protein AbraIFM66950_005760 [Aspergillus brasiliensis]